MTVTWADAVPIDLTRAQVFLVACVGNMRADFGEANKLPDKFQQTTPEEGRALHLRFGYPEFATGLHFRVFWDGTPGLLKTADVCGLEVRGTKARDAGMPFRPRRDSEFPPYVCAYAGELPRVWLRGWCRGSDHKRGEVRDFNDGNGAIYFVHNDVLRPMRELAVSTVYYAGADVIAAADFPSKPGRQLERAPAYLDGAKERPPWLVTLEDQFKRGAA